MEDGVGTLSGEMDPWYQKLEAAQKVSEAWADSVSNNIEVHFIPKIAQETSRE